MLKLYGTRKSRAFRCLWMLEECGVGYALEPTDFASEDVCQPEFLALNPNGKVPVLVDDDLVLFESLALNLYLADRYAPGLRCARQPELQQWMMWAMGELEGPHDAANRAGAEVDTARLDRSLSSLRRQLGASPFLLGDTFSVADLNVSAILLRPQYRPVVSTDADLSAWFSSCTERPALRRAVTGG